MKIVKFRYPFIMDEHLEGFKFLVIMNKAVYEYLVLAGFFCTCVHISDEQKPRSGNMESLHMSKYLQL